MTILRSLTDPKTGIKEELPETANTPQEEIKLREKYMQRRRKLGI